MSPRDRAGLCLTAAIGIAIALLAARATLALWRFAVAAPELPLWDEAKYGLDGARLAAAVADLDLPLFARLVYDLDVWPPLFPIIESAVFLVAGNQVAVARGLVAVLFLPLVLAAWWAGREIAPASPAVGALAAALVLASPFVQLFATHVMLELPGALLYLVCLASYAHFLRTGTRAALIATGLLTAALFFTKYNYGLLWIAPLVASEAWIACGGAGPVLDRSLALLRRIDLRRPFTAFVALYCAALAAIALSGGGTLRLAGAAVSVQSIGNPLFLLVVVLLARAAWPPRRAWARWSAWQRGLADRHRVLLFTVVVPAAIWLLLPPHLRNFVDFLENRSSGPSLASAEGVLFHPLAFVEAYHASPLIGIAVLVAAVTALLRFRGTTSAERVLLLAVAVALVTTTLHPYKEPRFFFVAAPLLWLAAAGNGVTLVEAGLARLRVPRLATNAALAAAILAATALIPAVAPGLGESFAAHTVPASSGAVLDRVVELAAERSTLVLGTWNQLSPPLVEWRFLEQHGATALEPPQTVVPSRRGVAAARVLRVLRDARGPRQVVLVGLAAEDAPSQEWARAYAEETAWLGPVELELEQGGVPYAPVSDQLWSGTGHRLRVFAASRSEPESLPE